MKFRKNELRRQFKAWRAKAVTVLGLVRDFAARLIGIPHVRIETYFWARKRFGADSEDFRRVMDAMNFAIRAHGKQMRKFDGKPYVSHLLSVARRVAERTSDVDLVLAAILHDTIEDTSVSKKDVTARFGERVADLVEWLTDVYTPAAYPTSNRKVRKALESKRLATAPAEVHLVKSCDLMDNAESIKKHDPNFWRGAFSKELRGLIVGLNKARPEDIKVLYAILKN